jgi:hypothetical protein
MPFFNNNDDVFIVYGEVERLKGFFEGLGLKFVLEKHGDGPEHFSCQVGEKVLEIYPKKEKS